MARKLAIGGVGIVPEAVVRSVLVLFFFSLAGEDVVCGAASVGDSLGGALSSLERKVAVLSREREESARLLETLRSEVEERRSEAAEGRSRSEEMSAAVRAELDGLRRQVESLREQQIASASAVSSGNQVRNDRVTMQWLRSAVRELRAEAAEAAAAQRNSSAETRRRDAEVSSGLSLLRSDAASLRRDLEEFRAEAQRSAAAFAQMKSDLAATRALHQNAAAMCSDTKAELKATQAEWAQALKLLRPSTTKDSKFERGMDYVEVERIADQKDGDSESEPDRKTRHLRHVSKQIESLKETDKQLFISQSRLDKQVRRLEKHMKMVLYRQRKHHRMEESKEAEHRSNDTPSNGHSTPLLPLIRELEERVDGLEESQKATARSSAFNASRQAAALDKLHLSTLQLLESVEAVESKIDRSVPELQREISKLEFGMAQAMSTARMLKEDQDSQRESVKAMGGSLSSLQEKAETELGTLSAMQLQLINITSQVESSEGTKSLESRILKLEDSFTDHLILLENDGRKETHERHHLLDMDQAVNSSDVPALVERLTRVQDDYIRVVNRLPRDCSEVRGPSGLYLVFPLVLGEEGGLTHQVRPSLPAMPSPQLVYCDQDNHDGGWTVIQRRVDGEVNFNRKWKEYQAGFGSPAGEFWIGNEVLHQMTHGDNCTELRVDMKDIYGRDWHAEYSAFSVAGEDDGYRLFAAGYHGDAGDALEYQNGMQFSTTDSDRDSSSTDCAASYEGGWWFSHCQHANLNGRYGLGLTWFDGGRNEWIAVARSVMKVRRKKDGECAPPEEVPPSSSTRAPTISTASSSQASTSSPASPAA